MSAKPPGAKSRFASKRAEAEPGPTKGLRIKVGVLKRIINDLTYAKADVIKEEERLAKIRASDPDRVPQQENVIEEVKRTVPETLNRMRAAVNDLTDYLEREKGAIQDQELLASAEAVLQDGERALADG